MASRILVYHAEMRCRVLLFLLLATYVTAQDRPSSCTDCVGWNKPQQPFKVYGNTYYVGTHGLAALLVTSESGHVLIDGALPESVPHIVANIRSVGFRVEDIKLIVNSHAHFDHAGGIAELQKLSGARVAGSAWTADVMKRGAVLVDSADDGDEIRALFSLEHAIQDGRPNANGSRRANARTASGSLDNSVAGTATPNEATMASCTGLVRCNW